LVSAEKSSDDERCRNDAHALLGVIRAMAEAVARRRKKLQTAKPFIYFLWPLLAHNPTGDDGD
jgi:hypothetical protein